MSFQEKFFKCFPVRKYLHCNEDPQHFSLLEKGCMGGKENSSNHSWLELDGHSQSLNHLSKKWLSPASLSAGARGGLIRNLGCFSLGLLRSNCPGCFRGNDG